MQHKVLEAGWGAVALSESSAGPARRAGGAGAKAVRPLYTAEERARRDATRWTLVQGVLAPLQFLVFLVSALLIVRFLLTGHGQAAATASVLLKTALLYTIMVTGAAWEKVVFGRWLFAPAFFWEDVVSMAVIALHTLYLWTWYSARVSADTGFAIALMAYGTYVVNAAQFLLKLRAARRDRGPGSPAAAGPEVAADGGGRAA